MAKEARERVNKGELEAFRLERIARQWRVDDEASGAKCRLGGFADLHAPPFVSSAELSHLRPKSS
jgi:hypothetical protein